MPKTTAPQRSSEEVASTIGENIKTTLAEQGRNLDWLAGQMDVTTHSILKAFATRVDMWLIFDASYYLDVPADRLIGANR